MTDWHYEGVIYGRSDEPQFDPGVLCEDGKCYHKRTIHEEATQSFPLDDQDIADHIKHRNGMTHDADQYISYEIAETTIKLRALISCCLLRRIGISEEKIVSISRMKLKKPCQL